MLLPQLFKTREKRQFTFIPRFYDKQKEELQARIRQIEREFQGSTDEGFAGSAIKGSFRRVHQKRSRENRNSLIRILVILIILLLIVYFLFTI